MAIKGVIKAMFICCMKLKLKMDAGLTDGQFLQPAALQTVTGEQERARRSVIVKISQSSDRRGEDGIQKEEIGGLRKEGECRDIQVNQRQTYQSQPARIHGDRK